MIKVYPIYIETKLKSEIIDSLINMKIIALASFTNGTMNLPKEVKDTLGITEVKGKVVFVLDNGKVYIQKA
jgi:hypothetical protein